MRVAAVWLALGAALASGTAVAGAQQAGPPPAIARWVPPAPDPRHVFVLDSAHVLSDSALRALQDSSRALQAATGADVVWVTLPSLGGRAIEEASLYVGRTWKVGNAGEIGDPTRNRGLVVLYVPDRRTTAAGSNFRVEVGRGLEGTITDSRSRRISAAMRTELRAKHYDAAYALGWAAAAQLVRADRETSQRRDAAPAPAPVRPVASSVAPETRHASPIAITILLGLLLAALLWIVVRAIRRRMPPAPPTIRLERHDRDEDDDAARRAAELTALSTMFDTDDRTRPSSGSDAGFDFGGGSDSGGGDDGGSLGDGGGFSGGGSDDSI